METRVFLKYFARGYLWKQFFAYNLPQARSNLICLTILVTLRSLTQFSPKTRATTLQKSAETCLT